MSTNSTNVRLILLAIGIGALAAVAGFSAWTLSQARTSPASLDMQQALIVLPQARTIPPFSLVDQRGEPFEAVRLQNKWTLWFFGFTHCPDVCPTTLYDLKVMNRQLTEKDRDAHIQVVFVSVDPERDTPERLGEYVAYFDPSFIGVTGEHGQLEPLTRKMGIAYRIEPHEDGAETYNVDHSASILLTGPDGKMRGVFPAPHDVPAMTSALLAAMSDG